MRMPGRVRIGWQDDNTLKVETDAGQQTKLFHFDRATARWSALTPGAFPRRVGGRVWCRPRRPWRRWRWRRPGGAARLWHRHLARGDGEPARWLPAQERHPYSRNAVVTRSRPEYRTRQRAVADRQEHGQQSHLPGPAVPLERAFHARARRDEVEAHSPVRWIRHSFPPSPTSASTEIRHELHRSVHHGSHPDGFDCGTAGVTPAGDGALRAGQHSSTPGNLAYLVAHAVGTQAYICLPSGATMAWTFFGPQATLFDDHSGRQVITPSSARTRAKTAPRARPGNAPVIRARSGGGDPASTDSSLSRPAPFLGCFCRSPVPRMARPAAAG